MFRRILQFKYSDILVTILSMISSTFLAFLLFNIVTNGLANIALIYILALILTARYTNGYKYGLIFSVYSVICINFFFTYPYFTLNFTLTGYPISFLIMTTIAVTTSATTSHLKMQSELLAEREDIINKAEKEKMRANLLRAISHDLRTPLTSIIGETNTYFTLNSTSGSDSRDELVHKINDDAIWLLHMVENLLTITRIQDNGITKVNKSSEVVEEIISEALIRFKKRLPDAIVKVIVPEDFIMIPMDPLLIEQVIINLLENAFVHSQSTKDIELTIKDDKTEVSFHVRDYGIGIRPDLLETIFDGTGTRDTSLSDAHRGMGIGLSICKTIIDAHNGTIGAINHETGSEFIFTLPKEDIK